MKHKLDSVDVLAILKDKKEFLRNKFGVQNIALFGSYVRDSQTLKSDIDLFVELDPNLKTFDNFMELKFYLESIFSNKVDIITIESIRKELKSKILKEAVYAQ